MRKLPILGLLAVLALVSGSGGARTLAPVRYVDAHVHLVRVLTASEEIAALKAAGVARGVFMHPEIAELKAATAIDPKFGIPFISIARIPAMKGLRLGPDSAAAMAALYAKGEVCGFGEIPTRIEPRAEPDDASHILNPDRQAIYAAANARGVPVNMHISLTNPATVKAVETIAARYPRMPIILAHAGWDADAATNAALMAKHPNIHADLSIRLDHPATASPNEVKLSVVGADGALKPDWRALIERFPDRFLFGLDVTGDQRPLRIAQLVRDAKVTLGALPRRVEEAVAHGNIERLIGSCGKRLARGRA
jgi:predicted TIM-barrel fold metal-dependent hydrolase